MNIAAILAMLLSSGVCGHSDFHGSDGRTLRVVVCPMMQGGDEDPADAPPAPPPPPKKDERQAMR